jgi:hypothetical protein
MVCIPDWAIDDSLPNKIQMINNKKGLVFIAGYFAPFSNFRAIGHGIDYLLKFENDAHR